MLLKYTQYHLVNIFCGIFSVSLQVWLLVLVSIIKFISGLSLSSHPLLINTIQWWIQHGALLNSNHKIPWKDLFGKKNC